MSQKISIHRFLTQTGLFANKQEVLVALKNDEIKIDGKIINNSLFRFRESTHKVTYKGKEIHSLKQNIYLLLNKPKGYLSSRLTKTDLKLKKKSIFDLLDLDEEIKKTLFCVGRLDEKTSGLIIITNDGYLGSFITDPHNQIKKTYDVELELPITKTDIERIEHGIIIKMEENGKHTQYKTTPCKIVPHKAKHLLIILKEGKKREVRRMFEAVKNKVKSLSRISIGKLLLKSLKLELGEYKLVQKDYIMKNIKT